MKLTIETFNALSVFTCYNEYGAVDELTLDDCHQWDDFIAALAVDAHGAPSHITTDNLNADELGLCEVTGLRGNIVKFIAVWVQA